MAAIGRFGAFKLERARDLGAGGAAHEGAGGARAAGPQSMLCSQGSDTMSLGEVHGASGRR